MAARIVDGWEVIESGPADAEHSVLLLPGGLCTAAFYDVLLEQPALQAASIRWLATTLPGFGATRPLEDLSMENLARGAGKLASDLGCDTVMGHSLGANVAIEMVAGGAFTGPVVLIEPAFSRADEYKELAILDRVGRVPGLGVLAWGAMLRTMGSTMKGELPPDRHDAWVGEMKQASARFCRDQVHVYFEYLDRHGALVPRLCGSGAKALVLFGDRSDVGLSDEEQRGLEACPDVTFVRVSDSGHFIASDRPARTAELLLDFLGPRATPPS
jgi:pimeloyl-ACP methyl ester carboxylesterase